MPSRPRLCFRKINDWQESSDKDFLGQTGEGFAGAQPRSRQRQAVGDLFITVRIGGMP